MKILKKGTEIKQFTDNEQLGSFFDDWINITNTEEGKNYLLQKAKEAKIAQLKVNLDIEARKPFSLIGVKQIDKDGKVIGTVNAFYNFQDAN